MRKVQSILSESKFGSRIAEDEQDQLESYFVETEQWRKILAGDVDIIFGAKGSGKSALYSLLSGKKEEFRLGRRTIFLPAENPRGTPVFRDLTTTQPLSEEQFRGLWKLYFLTILANYIRHHMDSSKIQIADAKEVIKFLNENNLLVENITLLRRLKAVMDYVRKWLPAIEGGVTDPNTGLAITGKITFSEPTPEQRGFGCKSLDELLEKLNAGFAAAKITAWILIDRLDVAFADSDELEGNALRSLFRSYLDMRNLGQFKFKIFLRDDIWKRIVSVGFREASHVTRTLTLSWDHQSLMNLLVSRLASNVLICDHYGMEAENVMADAKKQEDLFYHVFPVKVDKSRTLDWMVSRTADGTKRTVPRELIHLLLSIRDQQLHILRTYAATIETDGLRNSCRR